jgi:tRNA(Arg) A34 adenosine deaminase TadA
MEKLGRNPNDENSGAAWHAEMSKLKAAYAGLPPANCPAHAKLHRQAAINAADETGKERLKKTMRELGLDF